MVVALHREKSVFRIFLPSDGNMIPCLERKSKAVASFEKLEIRMRPIKQIKKTNQALKDIKNGNKDEPNQAN